MNTSELKKPQIIVSALGALLLFIGGLTKWLVVPSISLLNLVASEKDKLEKMMNTKSKVSLVLGLITLGFLLFGTIKRKKGYLITAVIFSILIIVPVATAYLPKSNSAAKLLRIDGMETAYFVSVLGTILLVGGSIATLVKSNFSKEESKAS